MWDLLILDSRYKARHPALAPFGLRTTLDVLAVVIGKETEINLVIQNLLSKI